ncbi:MAG: AAA family ATPase, partial [Candidatus Weimeria sp.]
MWLLPTSVQSFKTLRENGYLYVDKTKYIWDLVESGGR